MRLPRLWPTAECERRTPPSCTLGRGCVDENHPCSCFDDAKIDVHPMSTIHQRAKHRHLTSSSIRRGRTGTVRRRSWCLPWVYWPGQLSEHRRRHRQVGLGVLRGRGGQWLLLQVGHHTPARARTRARSRPRALSLSCAPRASLYALRQCTGIKTLALAPARSLARSLARSRALAAVEPMSRV